MAYLSPEFRHDVFISYSAGDVDGNGQSPLKAWSQKFAMDLQAELRLMPGFQEMTVFLDENKRPKRGLDRADPLTEQIRERAKGAAFLLILMSPHYLKSAWCADELKWWLEQIEDDPFPVVGNRVFIARIMPVPKEAWPRELCDERGNPPLGYCLHSGPDRKIPNLPFGWGGSSHGDDYFVQLVSLAGDIARRAEKLRGAIAWQREAQERWLPDQRRLLISPDSNRGAKIFISYRRSDNAAGYAMGLAIKLEPVFGKENVFFDQRSTPLGVDFAEIIEVNLKTCKVMLVVIGQHWTTISGSDGRPRLFDPNDWVRLEIAAALAKPKPGVPVIPVLVGDATLPKPEELPPGLERLPSRQSFRLDVAKWDSDVDYLIERLKEQVPGLASTL